ncbi:CBO0543 family protein [Paenibacillus marchantiophytorum]|uniref:CBO0543 family protein n=1 Tax=Paenibacillus TaxID=44249 RepID=UPI003570A1D9
MLCLLYFIACWRWGDWRNWAKYQSSILYLITFDLVYNFLTYNYSLWEYEPNTTLLPNHTIISLIVMFIIYPCVMLVYLGRYPTKRIKQYLWVTFWVFLWSFLEWVAQRIGEFSHHHGWNIWWSALFNIALYSMVRLHYKKPLLAYGLSVIATVGLIILFKVPISKMK